ncbi:MAG: hypothetical protein JNN28_21720 [Saprospiraceae bacterium]|nr:hypothetical protein [Saprospiraceae bacterium]
MRIIPLILLFIAFFSPYHTLLSAQSIYPDHVGDITPDPAVDDPAFRTCRANGIPQYYSIESGFEGEKPALLRYFAQNYQKKPDWSGENGYITVRFVVNCNGQTGRFRVLEMDMDYRPKTFPKAMSAHLLQLCQSLNGWKGGQSEGIPYDYYQYLTFTIQSGDIVRIMP